MNSILYIPSLKRFSSIIQTFRQEQYAKFGLQVPEMNVGPDFHVLCSRKAGAQNLLCYIRDCNDLLPLSEIHSFLCFEKDPVSCQDTFPRLRERYVKQLLTSRSNRTRSEEGFEAKKAFPASLIGLE